MDNASIGSIQISRVPELAAPLMPIGNFFPELTAEMLDGVRAGLPDGSLTTGDEMVLSFHSYVVKTGRYTILVDTCCGNDKDRPSRPAFSNLNTDYLSVLTASGCSPEDVDFVMCTHLHWDHIGWNTRLVDGQWVPTFPNAKYIMARREYDHWNGVLADGTANMHRYGFNDSVLPLMRAEKAVLVDDDYEIDSGIWLEPCHGHSPGHVVINLRSGGDNGVMTGDVIHHRVQLAYPHLSTIADTDPDQARQTRTALMAKHADLGSTVFPAHFLPPSFGQLVPTAGGSAYSWSSDLNS